MHWTPLAVAETAALRLQCSLCISSLKTRALRKQLLVTLGAMGDPWLTSAIHLNSNDHSSMAAKLCQSLGTQCVSWPLPGQSWPSWCSEVTFPPSWVNKLQCWKRPGAWLRQSLGCDSRSRLALTAAEIAWVTGAARCLVLIRLEAALDCSFRTFYVCLSEQVCLAQGKITPKLR